MKKVLFVLAVAGFFAACGGNTNQQLKLRQKLLQLKK